MINLRLRGAILFCSCLLIAVSSTGLLGSLQPQSVWGQEVIGQDVSEIGTTSAAQITDQLFLPSVSNPSSVEEEEPAEEVTNALSALDIPVVFVSRRIPGRGSVYHKTAKGMPGVGPFSRFQVAAPGKLIIREPNGSLRTLIDGSNPTAASLHLIDVNAPEVSYDGKRIVFAGFPSQANTPEAAEPVRNPNGWRIYMINVDGTNLRQITFSDQKLDLSQFGSKVIGTYDDTDPVWLPDGRIVFASTRYPSYSVYSGARATNLFVVNPDGSNLHRITSDKGGAERPVIDPQTGQIVYARWWRNQRAATNSMETIPHSSGTGYTQHLGLTIDNNRHVGGSGKLNRNFWPVSVVNPDGTGLAAWSGDYTGPHHFYGGSFAPDGTLVANYFPMTNLTEAAGFGGLRRYTRGMAGYKRIIGSAERSGTLLVAKPPSRGIFVGNYAADPAVLPDGRILFSWAPDIEQDYGLYLINPDGTGRNLVYNNPGTTELRARLVMPRPVPPIIPDTVTKVSKPLPPLEQGPYDINGTFVFDALNVYFNAPVDVPIANAPPVGSAATIEFFIDHQRRRMGTQPEREWPIRLEKMPVNPDGSVRNDHAPADVPLFETVRSSDGTVPLVINPNTGGVVGAAHVAGLNYGRPGSVQRCVGCHIGHTLIPVPENPADAQWTNLAPGATVKVSSAHKPARGLIDRKAQTQNSSGYWAGERGNPNNQWVELIFPVPVSVRTVRLYNPMRGGGANANLDVLNTNVRLFADVNKTNEVASKTSGPLATSGTDVHFNEVKVRVVRVEITSVKGTIYGKPGVSLAEIEVIARGEGIK